MLPRRTLRVAIGGLGAIGAAAIADYARPAPMVPVAALKKLVSPLAIGT